MPHGERASRIEKMVRIEYWGRLRFNERKQRRAAEHRLKRGADPDTERITSRRGRSEVTR